VTHDVNTMPGHAYQRIRQGEPVAGVFVVPQGFPIGQAIADRHSLGNAELKGTIPESNASTSTTATIIRGRTANLMRSYDQMHLPQGKACVGH
jgi:hypothetical protein